jgi:hypothetical protein
MQGVEAEPNNSESRVTVDSDGTSRPGRGVQRAADAASVLTRALSEAGYEPRHLSVTSSDTGELVLIARMEERAHFERPKAAVAIPSSIARSSMLTRLSIGVTLGLLLGFLGLPRFEVPGLSLPGAAPVATAPPAIPTPSAPQILSITDLAEPTPATPDDPAPTPVTQFAPAPTPATQFAPAPTPATQFAPAPLLTPAPPTPIVVPTPILVPTPTPITPAARASGALFDDTLARPIAGWPNDPRGTAWFGVAGYRLFAREKGSFVATGIPLSQPVQDVKITAQFQKTGGPPGGGYGLIVRDQGAPSERDGRNQSGEYLVLEVGDRGDVGIWQRDQTHWIDIVPWQHTEAVLADTSPNTLVVTTHGPDLMLEVNGQVVATVSYDKLPLQGGVGVFAGGDLNEVALEQLRIDNTN